MTPERKAEMRRHYPRPPENTRADTCVVRREVNELLDALDKLQPVVEAATHLYIAYDRWRLEANLNRWTELRAALLKAGEIE